jgi:hypothetical protein
MNATDEPTEEITVESYKALFEFNGHPPIITLERICQLLALQEAENRV